MNNIVTTKQAIQLSEELRNKGKTIVLSGGCFDILHTGHITFLRKAKEAGDILFVLLESDETIRELKGPSRPLHTQEERASLLSHLTMVDYVIKLPPIENDAFYDDLVLHIKPAVIATTRNDPNRHHKERQAKKINAQVIDVTDEIANKSTTKLIQLLNEL